MKKYLAEFIGTFFLVFVIVLVAQNGTGALAPLAAGATLVAMAYAASPISGAHFNPVVSLGMMLHGKLSRQDFPYYLLAQLLGAALAALISTFLLRSSQGPGDGAVSHEVLPALLAEFFGAFALTYVALHMASVRSKEGNAHYGPAVGFALLGLTYALDDLSGGAFNPAVALGLSIGHLVHWEEIWVYLLGNLLGGAAAATALQVMQEGRQD